MSEVPKTDSKLEVLAYAAILALEVSAACTEIPVYTHMIVLVSLILYVGCTSQVQSHEREEHQETMSTGDVYKFPILGSCVLFGLYCLFKYVPRVSSAHFCRPRLFCLSCRKRTNCLPRL